MDWKEAQAACLRTEPNNDQYKSAEMRLRNDFPNYNLNAGADPMRLLHAAMGLCTEVGELMDAVKKFVFYGKPLDKTNLIEEGGDIGWYLLLLAETLGVDLEIMLSRVLAKLRKRYPDKFESDKALNRDLDAERKALEDLPGPEKHGGGEEVYMKAEPQPIKVDGSPAQPLTDFAFTSRPLRSMAPLVKSRVVNAENPPKQPEDVYERIQSSPLMFFPVKPAETEAQMRERAREGMEKWGLPDLIAERLPDPTPQHLADPRFDVVWEAIKSWDISVPEAYHGYCDAMGNHVRAILDALDQNGMGTVTQKGKLMGFPFVPTPSPVKGQILNWKMPSFQAPLPDGIYGAKLVEEEYTPQAEELDRWLRDKEADQPPKDTEVRDEDCVGSD